MSCIWSLSTCAIVVSPVGKEHPPQYMSEIWSSEKNMTWWPLERKVPLYKQTFRISIQNSRITEWLRQRTYIFDRLKHIARAQRTTFNLRRRSCLYWNNEICKIYRIYRAFLSCLLAISKKQFTGPQNWRADERESLVCVYKTSRDVYWPRIINAKNFMRAIP